MPTQFAPQSVGVRGGPYPPPAIYTEKGPPIHWAVVAVVAALAMVLVVGFTAAAWLASRSIGVGREQTSAQTEAQPLATTADTGRPFLRKAEASAVRPAARIDEAAEPSDEAQIGQPVLPEANSELPDDLAVAANHKPAAELAGLGQPPARCETFGTRVQFVRNPTEAATLAQRDRKLVFLPQISGNFEEQRFT